MAKKAGALSSRRTNRQFPRSSETVWRLKCHSKSVWFQRVSVSRTNTLAAQAAGWKRGHTQQWAVTTHIIANRKHFYTSADEWKPIHAFAFVVYFIFHSILFRSIRATRTRTEAHAVIVVNESAADSSNGMRVCADWACVCGYARIHSTRVNSFTRRAFVLWFLDCRYTQRRGSIIRRSVMAFFLFGDSNYSGFQRDCAWAKHEK